MRTFLVLKILSLGETIALLAGPIMVKVLPLPVGP